MPDAPRRNFNRNAMLWLLVCFALGIVAGKFLNFELWPSVAVCVAFAILALPFRERPFATVFLSIAFVAAGMATFVAEASGVRQDRLRVLYDNGRLTSGTPVEVEGVLRGSPEPSADGDIITLQTSILRYRGEDLVVTGKVRIFVPRTEFADLRSEISNFKSETSDPEALMAQQLRHGSRVRAACRLEREDEFLNPGVLTRREMLDQIGIDAACSLKSPLLIEHLGEESVFLPLAWVYDQRARLIDEFRQHLRPRTAGVMIASLLGNKNFLDKDTADIFRDGGTFHVLVISGLHITFIGGILLLIIRQLTRNRWLQFISTIAILWAYTLAVGADVPVVRAAIMFTFVLFSYAIYRPGTMLNSLGLCGLILLVWRPSDLFGASFQLTFVSVAAIVGCAFPLLEHLRQIGAWSPSSSQPFPPNVPRWLSRFCEMLYWHAESYAVEAKRQIWTAKLFKQPLLKDRVTGVIRRVLRYVIEGLLVSFIVQLWMLPLTVVYFHRVSVASVLLNLWVGFFIALESFAAAAGAIAGYFSVLLAAGFHAISDAINWILLAVPWLITDGGWASFRLPAYSGRGISIYLVYFLPLFILAFAVNLWKPFSLKPQAEILRPKILASVFIVLAILIAIVIFHPLSAAAPDGRLHVDFLDVGQGDSALITFPNGQTMLIDGGGRFEYRDRGDEDEPFDRDVQGIGEAVVSEVLWNKGLGRLDHIVATHADADHIQGLIDVAKNFRIGSAVFGRTPPSDPEFTKLADVLRKRTISSEVIARGDTFDFGGSAVEVLSPTMSDDSNALSDNNSSIVLRVVYGNRSFLFTGDIEREAEQWLIANGGTLSANVVKVPHHGSRTSSTQGFVNAVGAGYAVISVGRQSPFGHPHPDVVERWKAVGTSVMTTGERGMISFSTDGRDLQIQTFVP